MDSSVVFHSSGDRQTSSERGVSIRGNCKVVVAHDDDGQATPDGVIVVAVLELCTCLTCSVICLVLSSVVDNDSGQWVVFGERGKMMVGG